MQFTDPMDMTRQQWVDEAANWIFLGDHAAKVNLNPHFPYSKVEDVLEHGKRIQTQKNLAVGMEDADAESEATRFMNGIYGSAQAKAALMNRNDNNTSVPKKHAKRSTRSIRICPNNSVFRKNRRAA